MCTKSSLSADGTSGAKKPMNLLVTLNAAYIPPLTVMLSSLLHTNPDRKIDLYLLHSSLTQADLNRIRAVLEESRCTLYPIKADSSLLAGAPVTDRYPQEMYYRIFAARYLPVQLDRVLYLDPDMVINGPLDELYETPLDGWLFAAASHLGRFFSAVNRRRLELGRDSTYINSGVMLFHLERLRREQDEAAVFHYIETNKDKLLLPDQDIISSLYEGNILPLDPFLYNMTEKLFALRPRSEAWLNLDWVRKHSLIIHYCGRNKPWKENYVGALGVFYREAATLLENKHSPKNPIHG
ncbi:MAG: glycosyltransferase family 8 protein [Oscillospiraceae bacterium]|nr:glycosyltransferase family 8 protein [Oscillospiraceae bacterium]